jgi:uncharacterized membrane protein
MSTLRLIVTGSALLGASALVGASLYDAVVLAPNLRGGPTALEHGRLFMSAATPANLFRILSPSTQFLLFLAVVVNWRSPQRRWLLVAALVALVLSDVITFTYHYPRNRLMFDAPLTVEPERLSRAAGEWAAANFLRVALVLGCWLATLIALMRLGLSRQST